MTPKILKVRDLTTRFFTDAGQVNAVSGLNFDLGQGEVLAVVGESGSGKSVTGLSLMDLIEAPGEITDGEIWFRSPQLADELGGQKEKEVVDGEYVNVRAVSPAIRQSLCGTEFGMIFQDPGAAFNPSLTVGEQIAEAVECNKRLDRGDTYGLLDLIRDILSPKSSFVSSESYERAIELLDRVDIPDPIDRVDEYPHQFSGGMLQRAMVAQALASDPTVLIADEPTTGLDVTIQAGIVDLLRELRVETGMSILIITHNLGVVSEIADRTAVMYAGELFEVGPTPQVFERPANPYTDGLLGSLPDFDDPNARIEPIPGNVPNLLAHEMPSGCSFADRCPKATEECAEINPPLEDLTEGDDHRVACLHAETTRRVAELSVESPIRADSRVDRGVTNE
ncbi:ABC transporter ATP-binding protein [Natronoglomus mannanivorans]|uniref:Nickel import system ATP-binding protein NikD n=1 Tax=Natronoglomus mannanivorans TaxID=2979990 RepID=A0AAP2Z0J6_9EURY|nr:ABC transporter ATP-binding protein [Halobacteria archaeon AArc-xg1-1]